MCKWYPFTLFTLFACCFTLQVHAQKATFKLSDESFEVGSIYRTYRIIFKPKTAVFEPESVIGLDSLVQFLQANKGLLVEVGAHIGKDHIAYYEVNNNQPDRNRAIAIVEYLIARDIPRVRLNPVGHGFYRPRFKRKDLAKMPKAERQSAEALNERIEIKIIGIIEP